MIPIRYFVVLFATILLVGCQPIPSNTTGTPAANLPVLAPSPSDPGILSDRPAPDLAQLPLLAKHLERVREALQQPIPILLLTDGLDSAQQKAQDIAVSDPRIQSFTHDPQTNAPLRVEVFGVYPLRASDLTEQTATCSADSCYRVEMYNFAMNAYLASVVDLQTGKILSAISYDNTQPDIPAGLTDIALEIATHSPEVSKALGNTPKTTDAVMANSKTGLNNTVCERSKHLCVAPTFVVDVLALWAIVDLTDGTLVGTRWTEVGQTTPITEKSLENDVIMRRYCLQDTHLEQDGWQMSYILTSSDGLRISDVSFQGVAVLDSVKLVDWHVSYSRSDGFGYSDAVGCPVFSQAAVVAVKPPTVEDIRSNGEVVGFALNQEFRSDLWPLPCSYCYAQRYEFYRDGRFRPVAINIGRGCGNDGTYWRLAADVKPNADGQSFKVSTANGGYYMLPSTGQFGDGGRGDNPYVYVTRYHRDLDEGESDMPTIGPCCNTDFHQGPEKFINPTPEPMVDTSLVVWYVGQFHNDDTKGQEYCWAESVLVDGLYVPREYPCPSGPFFVPITPVTAEPPNASG